MVNFWKITNHCKCIAFSEWAVLDLLFSEDEYLRVIVETGYSTCISMIVNSSDTILSLKLKLQQRNGISPEHQQIVVLGKDFPKDDMTLKQSGIVNNSVVYQVYQFSSTMQIFVKCLTGRTITIVVNESNTTWDLQALICRSQQIPPCKQRLIFSGKQLDVNKMLEDYKITEDCTIHLVLRLRGLTIFIKSLEKIDYLPVKSRNTIREIKNKLKEDFSFTRSCLIYSKTELEDLKTLDDYGVTPESVLHLIPAVCVKTAANSVLPLVGIHYNDKIHAIISQIQKQVYMTFTEPPCLSLDGEPLMNEQRTLHEISLKPDVTFMLHSSPLLAAPVQLNVVSSTGRTTLAAYSGTSTVKAVKRMIQRESGIPCKMQRLFLRGKELEDPKSLAEYNIASGSELNLVGDNTIESEELERLQIARLKAERVLSQKQNLQLQAEHVAEEERNLHKVAERRVEEAMQQMREAHIEEERKAAEREQELQSQLAEAQEALQHGTVATSGPTETDISPWKISRSDVHLIGEIGVGAWGSVARGMYNGQQVAVKYPHPMILNEDTLMRLERETELMTQVRHPNIIRIIAAVFDDSSYRLQAPPMILTEICDLNLRQCYEQRRLENTEKLPIFQDVAYGLHYLHDRQEPIIHRDVSAPNILLRALPNGSWHAKVSDFGSANLARLSRTAGEGAIIYTAPECFPQTDPTAERVPHTTKIDIYSYGMLVCEVITAKLPDPEQYLDRLEEVKRASTDIHQLIVWCTKRSPKERPTMMSVLDELSKMIHIQNLLARTSNQQFQY